MRTNPDACPGAVELHSAADGGLARIRVPGGTLSAAQWDVVRVASVELGSGSLELTSRANLQIRGLADGVELGARLRLAGLLPSDTHERIRNIIAAPLESNQPLVDALDSALCADPALASLPGRFLVTVGESVSGLGGDFGLVDDVLLLAGTDTGVRVHDPVDAVVTAARLFQETRGTAWRLSEVDDGVRKITEHFGTTDAPRITPAVTPVAPSATTPGVPLGRLDATLLAGIPVRLTPWRSLVVPPGTDTTGLITDPASPWHGVSACTGRPGCAKSLSDVRADVQAWLERPELSDPLEMIGMGTRSPQGALQSGSIPQRPVHWSGCSRRCGRPAGDVIEFVATGDGYEEIR
ncbi:MAG: precorrin-3B synthase [Pseudonocardiales bacterium]|jgi:precorrin-3B synthase|nr:precorrin-3B synthase [Pseudonocardiales bacterium]